MKTQSKSIGYLFTKSIALTLLPIILYLLGLNFLAVVAVEVFIILCYLCLKDLSSNIFFLGFLFSFFIFLMSGDIVADLFGEYYHIRFGEEAVRHSWIAILISLIFLYLGYITKRKTAKFQLKISSKSLNVYKIQNAAKVLFYLTYCILLFNTIDKILFVRRYGYVAYYSSYRPFLPSIIAEFGDFTPILLCVYLATFPTKRDAKIPIIVYFIYAALSLLIGARGGLVYNAVFLIGYMFYRNKHDEDGEVWLSKKIIVLLCVSIPFVLVFLFLYGYVRLGQEVVYNSFGETLVNFFVNIGSSSTIIKYGYEYKDAIETFKFYSLGDTINYFKYGKLFNLLNLNEIPSTHSAEFALEGHSFDAFLSYQFMRAQYLSGEGAGSSFVAVLFADFGYVGVAIGSFIYGMIFKALSSLNNKSWLSTAIKLYFFLLLIKAPRGSYDSFLGGIININFWIVIFGVVLVSQYVKGRKVNEIK